MKTRFIELDFMKCDEVEEVINLEYEVLGASPFVAISMLPFKKRVIVAKVDDNIVGCATVCWKNKFEIASLVVRKEHRKKGIGSAIIKKCVEIAKELGFSTIWLETPENGPIEFYKIHGFYIDSFVKNMYGENLSGIKMIKHI